MQSVKWQTKRAKRRERQKQEWKRKNTSVVSKCGSPSKNEKNRGETGRERQTKLGHVTWLGLTAGRIKYPTACGHLHNKCSFLFINYFSSTGTEAQHSKREAVPYSGWQPRLFSENKSGALKTWATRSLRDGKQSSSLRYRENDHNRRKHGSNVWWLHCDRLIALSICFEKVKDGETHKQSLLKNQVYPQLCSFRPFQKK